MNVGKQKIALGCYTVSDSLALVACERSGEVQGLSYEKDTGMFKTIVMLKGLFRPASLLAGAELFAQKRRKEQQ